MLAMRSYSICACACVSLIALGLPCSAAVASCESLSGLKLPDGKVTTAVQVAAGAFTPPRGKPSKLDTDRFQKTPAFCRVVAEVEPAQDSHIAIEVWMPLAGWNRKYRGQGNGGFAGSVAYGLMALAVTRGYATSGSDTGHQGDATEASWALGHPQQIIDFGYRAVHETAERAKTIIQAFYDEGAQRSYFESCSDGGREALMEAQRFPEDYDGIIAGAPANYWTHLLTGGLDVEQTMLAKPANYIPASKIPAIASAVNRACDALDGVKDSILNDPRQCHFDPAAIQCKGSDSDACLTPDQVTTLRKIYAGGKLPDGTQIFPGLMPGGEDGDGGWKNWVMGPAPGEADISKYVNHYFQDMVFDNPQWNFHQANVAKALRAADKRTAKMLNSTNPDLSAFQKRGGKLILYHGWNDPAIAPLNTIHYYNTVIGKMNASTVSQFVRLYMVPGMQHCARGPGPSYFGQVGTPAEHDPQHDVYSALEEWVEQDRAPGAIVATKYTDDDPDKGVQMTRPLCVYPEVAKYKGSGDTNDAANFSCAVEKE
ncbi:MAG TPA: tannase/feruloyl esterase family alpha/beta hydrolase [Bryobacteraceae bacterium]|jgi:feruloyl esterase|nr:tannase/feruloyl esterase family alpha/beta hydrolase [Bryobacteraceae bacterium]